MIKMMREVVPLIEDRYGIKIVQSNIHSPKSYKLVSEQGNCYFCKHTTRLAHEKYQFLANLGINNVLYPKPNLSQEFVTGFDGGYLYISDFLEEANIVKEVKASQMYRELKKLHHATSFARQLDASTARPKFDELTNQLDYKFRLLEHFVRSIEAKPLGTFSMPILENYHHFLDAKTEMVRLQKRVISTVKDKESVFFSYLHNNPKLDHILIVRGSKYLTSLENGKIGINSLDLAKFYVENQDLNIDFSQIIKDYYQNENNSFYYDYFRFLVLVIYIKRIVVHQLDHISAQNFIANAEQIKKYFALFPDSGE
ncbi:MAG TPA: hypothetical protein PLA20_03780 [Bacilli bacterium]|nr:hypothetical protein [Bacilli bacterium]HPD12872.1 hypothetical protein [Bacilli bacterium]HRS30548.1 hypothetical protein [Bacilli bacterium]HRU48740.1 hypothetical protein [Bacilli bacterium]